MANYPELASRFLAADIRLAEKINADKDAAYEVISQSSGNDAGVYSRFDFRFYPEFEKEDYEEIANNAKFLYEDGLIENEVDVDSIYDLTYLEKAKELVNE